MKFSAAVCLFIALTYGAETHADTPQNPEQKIATGEYNPVSDYQLQIPVARASYQAFVALTLADPDITQSEKISRITRRARNIQDAFERERRSEYKAYFHRFSEAHSCTKSSRDSSGTKRECPGDDKCVSKGPDFYTRRDLVAVWGDDDKSWSHLRSFRRGKWRSARDVQIKDNQSTMCAADLTKSGAGAKRRLNFAHFVYRPEAVDRIVTAETVDYMQRVQSP